MKTAGKKNSHTLHEHHTSKAKTQNTHGHETVHYVSRITALIHHRQMQCITNLNICIECIPIQHKRCSVEHKQHIFVHLIFRHVCFTAEMCPKTKNSTNIQLLFISLPNIIHHKLHTEHNLLPLPFTIDPHSPEIHPLYKILVKTETYTAIIQTHEHENKMQYLVLYT